MASSKFLARRRRFLQSGLIGAAIFAAAVAITPIIFAALGILGPNAGPRTAFASAPPGQYAVVSRTEGDTDVLAIVPSDNPAGARDVAQITHLADMGVKGAVSPDASHVAVVAATGGTLASPTGSLLVVDLVTGKVTTLVEGIDPQQTPAWTPSSDAIVVSRDSGAGPIDVEFLRVPIDGDQSTTIDTIPAVLGAYAVGFDGKGRFVDVAIDGHGSTARRAGKPLQMISTQITRDWQLSPDGTQLAFIESNLQGGLHYDGRTVSLDGASTASVESQTASSSGQQLGVVWQAGATQPTFGQDPSSSLAAATTASSSAESQVAAPSGFDVPIAYSRDGSTLAVEHWSGASFDAAGQSTLQLVHDGTATPITAFSRFLGWTAR